MVPNPDFGKRLREIKQQINCEGMQLAGAKGLDAEAPDGESTLGGWLERRGAIL